MPRRDGTGPLGQGAVTGRGFGNCTDAFAEFGFGRGRGNGFWSIFSILFGVIAGLYYVLQKLETKISKTEERRQNYAKR